MATQSITERLLHPAAAADGWRRWRTATPEELAAERRELVRKDLETLVALELAERVLTLAAVRIGDCPIEELVTEGEPPPTARERVLTTDPANEQDGRAEIITVRKPSPYLDLPPGELGLALSVMPKVLTQERPRSMLDRLCLAFVILAGQGKPPQPRPPLQWLIDAQAEARSVLQDATVDLLEMRQLEGMIAGIQRGRQWETGKTALLEIRFGYESAYEVMRRYEAEAKRQEAEARTAQAEEKANQAELEAAALRAAQAKDSRLQDEVHETLEIAREWKKGEERRRKKARERGRKQGGQSKDAPGAREALRKQMATFAKDPEKRKWTQQALIEKGVRAVNANRANAGKQGGLGCEWTSYRYLIPPALRRKRKPKKE